MCVCVCVRALIFESIGCSITAHFTFKTHHVAWTLKWILQPRSGVYFSHYAFHIESSKRTLILCSVRQNQVQMCCAEREQYWWQGRLGWPWLWEHDQDAFADAIDPPDEMAHSSWLLWPVRGFAMTMGYANSRVNIRKQWEIGWRLKGKILWLDVTVRWDLIQNKYVLNSFFSCAVWSHFYLPHISDLSENRSSSVVHLSLTPGAGPGVLGSICSLCRTDVQANGLVESRADTGTGGQRGSAVPGPPPSLRFFSKWKKVWKCKFPEFLSTEQHFQMTDHLSLGHISFYISTICRYIGRHKYK